MVPAARSQQQVDWVGSSPKTLVQTRAELIYALGRPGSTCRGPRPKLLVAGSRVAR